MASYVKHSQYVEDLNLGVHNFGSHTLKWAITNAAPNAAHAVIADITQIANGNGYTTGGLTADSVVLSETSGTSKLVIADEVLTASGGSVGPLRGVELVNDTPTSPADPLIGGWDYGSSITLLVTETLTIDVNATNGVWQLA